MFGAFASALLFAPQQIVEPVEPEQTRGPPNFQTNPEYARIDRERGAIMCLWLIATELKAIHQQCHAEESPEIGAALDRSLERLHAFIVANSDQSRASLEASVARKLTDARSEAGICTGDGERFYQDLTRNGAAGIDHWTEQAVAIPRPPVFNPCL